MNTRNTMLAAAAAALLALFSLDGFAVGAKIPFTHASTGTIVSIDSNTLVVTHQKNGKAETLKFVLSPQTSRRGDLAVGTVVSVHYRMDKDRRVATTIQAQRPNAPERNSK